MILYIGSESLKNINEGLGISWPGEWLNLWESLHWGFCLTGKVFPVNAMKAYGGGRDIAPLILNLDPG
jgi:hypothetical protein